MFDLLKKLFIKEPERNLGLVDEKDPRTFGVANVLGSVSREDLTEDDFYNCSINLVHQLDSDHCVGESGGYGSQATESDPEDDTYSGSFLFAVSKGQNWATYGMSILKMCQGKIEHGICVRKFWQLKSGKRDYYSNPNNIPAVAWDNAKCHKADSYGMIYPEYRWDKFDLFRAYLNKYHEKKIVIHSGVDGHAITFIGQKTLNEEMKLYGPDSYGDESISYRLGKSINGWRYFNRWEVNQLFDGYIIFDIPRSLAELLNKYNLKAIKLKDSPKCFLVNNGKRHYLAEEKIAWSWNCLLDNPYNVYEVSQEDMDLIPEGEPAKFEEGKYYPIIRRIMEKYKLN